DINSPGGYVDGLMPAVDALRSAEKPTTAYISGMAASAAYWLASQTDEIILASPAARVGSIGVAVEIYDFTKALEMEGIEKIILTSTDAPLKRPDVTTEEGQELVVDSLDDMHNIFVQYVAEGRGIDAGEVTDKYGRGGMLIAENALAVGMVDSIEKVPARRAETILDVIQTNTAAEVEIKQEVKTMNLDELKKENPGVFAEAVTLGIEQERARASELRTYIEADPDNLKLAEVVNTAIASGQKVGEVNAKIQVAIRDGGKLAGENAPDVQTAGSVEALGADDAAAAKEAGMTVEEYKKAQAYLNKEGK
ncbi:S49 family peptidase, partial [bacterium]|nr:S49 family peptidase [bacterium]